MLCADHPSRVCKALHIKCCGFRVQFPILHSLGLEIQSAHFRLQALNRLLDGLFHSST